MNIPFSLGKKNILVWLTLPFILSALACGTVSVQPIQPGGDSTTANDTAQVNIVNAGQSPVCYLYISESGSTDWGTDQLGDNQKIEPGQTITIELTANHQWDFRAQDCNENDVLLEQNVILQAGGQYQVQVEPGALAPAESPTFARVTVNNASNTRVCAIYISSSASEDYGDNLLGTSALEAGKMVEIEVPAGEAFDLQVQNCSEGVLLEEFDVTLASGENRQFDVQSAAAPTGTGEVELVNHTAVSICDVYIVDNAQSGWGTDLFSSDLETVLPGQGYAFELDAGTYKFRAVDCDGNVLSEEKNVEVSVGDQLEWAAGE